MSDFIKLTKVTFVWDKLEPTTNVCAMRPDDIISLTETEINNIKCTELETTCNNGVIRYYVKESVDEILRKIDPLEYRDLEKYIFNTTHPERSCMHCKYSGKLSSEEPCRSCDPHHNKWEPEEDQND